MKKPSRQLPGGAIDRMTAFLAALSDWLAASALVAMTAITGWQVFGRYVLNDTPAWSEQASGILMVYLAFFGAATLVRDDGHLSLTALKHRLPEAGRLFLGRVILILIAAFGGVMIVYGVEMAGIVRHWTIPAIGVSRAINYFTFPPAGLLTAIFAVARLRRLSARRKERDGS